MIYPASGRISQGFSASHEAIDIVGAYRSDIVAPYDGVIIATGQMGSGTNDAGLAIDIRSNDGRFKARLAHNDSISTRVGEKVSQGQVIGKQGYTGYTIPRGIEGTHCHFVLWDNDTRVDARNYIKGDVKVDKITKEQDNTMSFLATGDYPGKNYDYRWVGQAKTDAVVNQWLNFWLEVKREWEKNKSKGITRQEAIDYVIKNLK